MLTTLRAVGLGAALIFIPAACSAQADGAHMSHPNSIQPETTISISASSSVDREPDLAILSGGVTTEAKTAKDAIAQNARDMAGLFSALKGAGIDDRDIQTSNFSLQQRYIYPKVSSSRSGERVLAGYVASNQVSVRVREIEAVGSVIDAMVAQGGNTFNGVSFALDEPKAVQDEARQLAMKDAIARAELYASAAGYKVGRIVTISEGGNFNSQPRPVMAMRSMDMAEAAPTPIAGGEVSYSASVNVVFELTK